MRAPATSSPLLPFLDGQPNSVRLSDPQVWAELVSGMLPVAICEPLQIHQPFHNTTALVNFGCIEAVSTFGSSISVVIEDHATAHLMVPYGGNGIWTIDGDRYENPAGDSVLYLPPSPVELENTLTAGVSLNVAPKCLLETALAMAGSEGVNLNLHHALQLPQRISRTEPTNRNLISCLYATLNAADQCLRGAPSAFPMLRFDDQLLRLLLLLLIPELRQCDGKAAAYQEQRSGEVVLDELIGWIEMHLDQPLSLSDLEAQAHCSRRTLQMHFRRRFDCSPMQWLRQRRMQQALDQLRRPGTAPSVWRVAQACGYTNLSAFSRDFRAMHGQRPTDVLRGTEAEIIAIRSNGASA